MPFHKTIHSSRTKVPVNRGAEKGESNERAATNERHRPNGIGFGSQASEFRLRVPHFAQTGVRRKAAARPLAMLPPAFFPTHPTLGAGERLFRWRSKNAKMGADFFLFVFLRRPNAYLRAVGTNPLPPPTKNSTSSSTFPHLSDIFFPSRTDSLAPPSPPL